MTAAGNLQSNVQTGGIFGSLNNDARPVSVLPFGGLLSLIISILKTTVNMLI